MKPNPNVRRLHSTLTITLVMTSLSSLFPHNLLPNTALQEGIETANLRVALQGFAGGRLPKR